VNVSSYTAEDYSNDVHTDRKIALYSVTISAAEFSRRRSTYGREIRKRTIHVSQKEVSKLHRV
jgi:hypothetical protein